MRAGNTRQFVTAARAAVRRGYSELAPALVPRLEDGELRARIEAARALAHLGSNAEVEALKPHTRGLLTDAALKKAAREAIAQITERAGPAVPGALAVVEAETGDEGQLALSEGQGGELSAAQRKRSTD